MKKIINVIILLFASISVFAQVNSLESVYTNNFDENIDGISAFNGGSVSQNGTVLEITNSDGSARGAIFDYINEASSNYELVINVSDLGASTGLEVLSKWATRIDTITTTGIHNYTFTTDATGGGFGNKVILRPLGSSTVKVEYISYQLENTLGTQPTRSELENKIQAQSLLGSAFNYETVGVSRSGYSAPFELKNGTLKTSMTSQSQFLVFGLDEIPENSLVRFYIDVEYVSTTYTVRMREDGNLQTQKTYSISESGNYSFLFTKKDDYTSSASQNGICLNSTTTTGTIILNSYRIEVVPDPFVYFKTVNIGDGASSANTAGGENVENPVTIGYNASSPVAGVVTIGTGAETFNTPLFGANQAGGEAVAIGVKAKTGGWRGTATGAESLAGGQSSTANGSGSEALTSHGIAIGRGSYLHHYPTNATNSQSETVNTITFDADQIYLDNGWAHNYPEPTSNQSRNGYTPSQEEAVYNGMDAFDARYPQWLNSDTYSQYNIVFNNDSLFYSNINSNTGNNATITNSNWTFWMVDNQGAASDFNVDGGHLALRSGRGTGTGIGGEIRLYNSPMTGTKSGNQKNDSALVAKFASDESLSDGTNFHLLDESDNTLKRVKIDSPNSLDGTRGIIILNKGLYLDQ